MIITFAFGSSGLAQTITPTPPNSPAATDIKQNLEPRFNLIKQEYESRRLKAGATLLVGGVAAAFGAATTPLVTDLDETKSYPLIFGAISLLLTAGGFYILANPTEAENVSHTFLETTDLTVEAMEAKSHEGSRSFSDLAELSHSRRISSAIFQAAGGLSQIILSYSGQDLRTQELPISGYVFSGLGYFTLQTERTLTNSGILALIGLSNIVTTTLDKTAPSKDYLFVTGSLLIVSGVYRFFKTDLIESEDAEFQKWSSPSVGFDLIKNGGIFRVSWAL